MDYSTGKLAFIGILAVVLTALGSWLLAWRYRLAMRRLMSAPVGVSRAPVMVAVPRAGIAEAKAADLDGASSPRAALDFADNRRAGWQLTIALVVLSMLIALSAAVLQNRVLVPDEPLSWKRVAVRTVVHLWPAIPALGVVWRWSRGRIAVLLGMWFLLCFAIIQWRSVESMPLQSLAYLGLEIGPPALLIALLLLGDATRAIAPWLLPPLIGFVWASIAGIDVLWLLVERRSPWLMGLPAWLGAHTVMSAFTVLPWLIAWWPLKAVGRALARAYARKHLSELSVLFGTAWAVSLFWQALSAASSLGAGGTVMLLPLLWLPLALLVGRQWYRRGARAPTLLVLRVFRRDAEVQALFDTVIERWRLTGNTVLIAGTDLADRTLDADDIFTFIDGRLAERFIRDPAEVDARIAAFDLERDSDGRYRINECYCHDTTWQVALDALVRRSDVVLMDLRGFQAHNAGCLHELAVLSRQSGLQRVVVLADAVSDRAAAASAVAGAAPDRFVWLDASRIGARLIAEVLQQLFMPRTAAAPSSMQPAGVR